MVHLPAHLPAPVPPPAEVVEQCISYAAQGYDIHPFVIASVLQVENGEVGTISRNTDGSYDLGLMQINTVNLPVIKQHFPGITWRQLAYSPCINIGIGTWFLKRQIDRADGDVWKGVGNYHSATPRLHRRYLKKVKAKFRAMVERYRQLVSSSSQ